MIPSTRADRMPWLVAGGLILAALALVFLLPWNLLLCGRDTDMVSEYVAWRAFLGDNLRHGHIPLWNPYTYAGQPFLGGFESGVLYPPNWLFAIMPLGPALNFSILLHLILLGFGVERWARFRGLHPWAAALAGLVMPLSGPVFPHLFAGHLTHLCTMAWAPWIFLGLERWTRKGDRRGLFLASAAICLQLVAGHIQYFFFTAIAAGVQSLVLTIAEPAARRRALPGCAICYLAGALLGAAQLVPGLAAAREGVRQTNLDYDFAAMFGFPPENFLTVIAPGFFGTLVEPRLYNEAGQSVYWGRCYLWEMSLFLGAVGPLLIAIAVAAREARRRAVLDLVVAGLLLLLAVGVHTPLFDLFYWYAPGFGHFRAWSKFDFPAMLFLVLVMAAGADLLLRRKMPPRAIAWAGISCGGGALLFGGALLLAPESLAGLFQFIPITHESYLPADFFTRPDTLRTAGDNAGASLLLAGTVLIVAGGCLYFQARQPSLRFALPAILALEMIGYAGGIIPHAYLTDAMPDQLRQFVAQHPGDYRVLNAQRPDNGFLLGAGDINGNNPSVLRRYAEFMFATQGADPNHATQYLPIQTLNPLYAMLRLRYVFVPDNNGFRIVQSSAEPLPQLALISGWTLLSGRDAEIAAMRDPSFDPAKTVVLETAPQPAPAPGGATGTVKLVTSGSDELVIDATTDKPTLLLITDLYASDWRAQALPGSDQTSYQVLPADYILRAIPLAAGHHRLRVVYSPVAYPIGVALSALALAAWLILYVRFRHEPESAPPTAVPSAKKAKKSRGTDLSR